MQCPKCGGDMTDQRTTKQNPKQPDYTCQDPSCLNDKGYRTGVWLKKAVPARAGGNGATTRAPKWTWTQLQDTYRNALRISAALVPTLVKGASSTDVVSGAATIFIAASRDGVQPPPQPLDEKPKTIIEAEKEDEDALPW